MENSSAFEDLHFQMGDGNLNYYMYNWIMNCRKLEDPAKLGVVLFWFVTQTNLWISKYLNDDKQMIK